jgi:hypothetical protein
MQGGWYEGEWFEGEREGKGARLMRNGSMKVSAHLLGFKVGCGVQGLKFRLLLITSMIKGSLESQTSAH